ncbi:single-stranded-DNA-specific exonuclease RecJ [Candidatus Berkelbacteria bacterium]|nr:single-stranded-DNA-specific exonuclease RecJ [Candidatus Berkelbacteria bacterium]
MGNATTLPNRRWVIAERTEPDIVEQLLANRGIMDRERFFHPDFARDSHDPFLLPGMEQAVARIAQAIKAGETVGVFADYDADGINAGALLVKVFRSIGLTVVPYVPDREREGYGLNEIGLRSLKKQDVSLVVTVDLGITARSEVALAQSLGIDVIVTDHHHIDHDRIPTEAVALVHPGLPGSSYPFQGLAGGGVAWKLVQALQQNLNQPELAQLKWWFELPAISTVCDIVPLTGENRMIVHYGLKVLMQTRNLGLRALYRAAGITPDTITEWTIGFQIGPRINAPGRIDHASAALELLVTEDEATATTLAAKLEQQNQERQAQLEVLVLDAVTTVRQQKLHGQPAIVVAGDGWPAGLVGLVASRLVERFHRPTIVLGIEGDRAKGSGRSIDGFNLLAAIDAQAALLLGYGGHEKAAGLHLQTQHIEAFRQRFVAGAAKVLTPELLEPVFRADLQISPGQITETLVTDLLRFAPHGMGNPTIKFVVSPLTIAAVKSVGAEGKHLKLRCAEGPEGGLDAIGFGLGKLASTLTVGERIEALGSLEFNSYNGIERIQLKLNDLRTMIG